MKIDPNDLSDQDNYYLLMGCVVPRPIAWVSTVGANGVVNAAPFSCYMVVTNRPPIISFSVGQRRDGKKDTVKNIEYSGDFVINAVDDELAEAMNLTSADFPPEVSELEEAKLIPVASELVKSPRISEAPISLECKVVKLLEMGKGPNAVIFGEVVRYHLRDGLYSDKSVDPSLLKPLGRLAGDLYCRSHDVFTMKRASLPSFDS